MKKAFSDLFERNEHVYKLNRSKLTSLVIETTGYAKDDSKTRGIVGTFLALNDMADFEGDVSSQPRDESEQDVPQTEQLSVTTTAKHKIDPEKNVDFRVSYIINLNLPETDNLDVFNAIFKSLRENLLRN